jgi:transcriptional regulator with PAS, ATPase and Fis domain
MVKEGTFREDLYYRINVMSIRAPALREHNEDVPQLAEHFLREYSRIYQRPANRITPSAMALLVQYDWPGNVRELQNVIQRAIILNDNYTVQSSDLPSNMQHAGPLAGDSIPGASFESLMQDYKTKLALKAVEDCKGNKTLAARSLNISRTYLHRLIKDPEANDAEANDESQAASDVYEAHPRGPLLADDVDERPLSRRLGNGG